MLRLNSSSFCMDMKVGRPVRNDTRGDATGGVDWWTVPVQAGPARKTGAFAALTAQRLGSDASDDDLLLRAATSEADDVSCNAIDALVKVAPRDGLPAFRQAVRSDSPLVRFAGYAALGEIRDCDSRALFVAGIKDASPHVRLAAAFAACR